MPGSAIGRPYGDIGVALDQIDQTVVDRQLDLNVRVAPWEVAQERRQQVQTQQLAGAPQLLVFAAQMGMLWVLMGDHPGANWSGGSDEDVNRLGAFLGPMSQALADVDVQRAIPPSDLLTGERYGERFAQIVRRWKGEGDYSTPRYRDAATMAALRAAAAVTAAA
jgi:hypothetical protein